MLTDEAAHDAVTEIVKVELHDAPVRVTRFATGLRHFVYEAAFRDGPSVVVRLSRREDRAVCRSAAALSRQLRPLGVPLPELIVDGSQADIPFLILERLAGSDLGAIARRLDPARLDRIARQVAAAQAVVSKLPHNGRYGYAARPEDAPFATWSEVLDAHLARTQARMTPLDRDALDVIETCAALLSRLRPELDALAPTPFLHDTTTKNVIVADDGEFTGIVDVDDLCYGDPRQVAALTLASLSQGSSQGGHPEYVTMWMRRAGWIDDRLFRLYVALFLADFMSELGHPFNGNVAPVKPGERSALKRAFDQAALRVA
jgi:aminoglycoside phosphotransferase (APT) family kinase protein